MSLDCISKPHYKYNYCIAQKFRWEILIYKFDGRNIDKLTVNFPIQMFHYNVTEPEKTGLIYTKYTYSYYGAYLFFRVCYPNSVSFIKFLRILCLYQEICVKMHASPENPCIIHHSSCSCNSIYHQVIQSF